MAKWANDLVMDAALDYIATADEQNACSAQPATYYEGCDPAAWVTVTNYAVGDVVRPTTRNGYVYEATADAGSSGGSEPTWPTTPGNTVVDGGITWTCRANYVLATVALAGGDFTKANGDTSGRKVTTAAKSGNVIHTSGTATHVCQVDDGTKALTYVTTCTSQVLTANGSNTVDFPAWKVEIADPS